jgi:hypothetical protein
MASTYSGGVSIELIGAGDQAGTWGATTNENWKRIEQSVSTYSTVSLSGQSSPYDWTLSNTASAGAANTEGRSAFVEFTNADSALTINIRGASASDYPNRVFFVLNSSGYDLTFDCNSSTDFVLKNGYGAAVYTNPGTAVGNVFNTLQVGSGASGILIKDGYVEASGGTLNLGSSAVTTSGNITTTGSGALSVNGAATVSGVSTLNGNVILGSDTSDDVTVNGVLASDIIPKTNNNADLGSSSKKFAQIFTVALSATGTSSLTTVDIDGGNIDGTTIAGSSISGAAGSFTTLAASDTTTLNGDIVLGNASGDDITSNGSWLGGIVPKNNNSINIGSSSKRFDNAYLNNADIAGTFTTGGTITTSGNIQTTSSGNIQTTGSGNIISAGGLTVAGASALNGNVTLGSDTSDDVTVSGLLASDIIPKTDDGPDLGSTSKRFAEVWTGSINANAASTLTTVNATTVNATTVNATNFNGNVTSDAGNITTLTSTTVNSTTVDTSILEVSSIKARDSSPSASIANSTGVMTINSSVLTTTDINGGSIDGATVGSESANTGKFTTLEATSTINFNGANCYSASGSDSTVGNILIGPNAGSNLDGSESRNIFIGRDAGLESDGVTAIQNTYVGFYAGKECTAAGANVAIGYQALAGASGSAMTGSENVAVGDRALYLIAGNALDNTAVGMGAGFYLTSGSFNTFLGRGAGADGGVTTMSDCTLLGEGTGVYTNGATNAIAIGRDVSSTTDTVRIGDGGTYIQAAYDNSSWSTGSDRRIKKDIENSDIGLDFINALRPVSFKFKQPEDIVGDEEQAIKDCISKVDDDGNETVSKSAETRRGFIAQEVKEAIDSLGLSGENLGWSEALDGVQRVGSGDFIPALVAAVQELSQKVKDLEDRLSD